MVQALLAAGAGVVVSNLWTVDDEVLRVYFTTLYEAIAFRASVVDAMYVAAAEVRCQHRWQDPHYWAGFTLHGLADLGRAQTRPVTGQRKSASNRDGRRRHRT